MVWWLQDSDRIGQDSHRKTASIVTDARTIPARLPPLHRLLDAGTRLVDVVDPLGPLGSAKAFGHRGTGSAFDRVIAGL